MLTGHLYAEGGWFNCVIKYLFYKDICICVFMMLSICVYVDRTFGMERELGVIVYLCY